MKHGVDKSLQVSRSLTVGLWACPGHAAPSILRLLIAFDQNNTFSWSTLTNYKRQKDAPKQYHLSFYGICNTLVPMIK